MPPVQNPPLDPGCRCWGKALPAGSRWCGAPRAERQCRSIGAFLECLAPTCDPSRKSDPLTPRTNVRYHEYRGVHCLLVGATASYPTVSPLTLTWMNRIHRIKKEPNILSILSIHVHRTVVSFVVNSVQTRQKGHHHAQPARRP